jgi:UDP:flavonoid glycosyltransferase YjiC (YdhE family)
MGDRGLRARRGGRALRLLVAAFGDAGHAFPAIALARALAERGHEVAVESWERWRVPVEALGIPFHAAQEFRVFPPAQPDGLPRSRVAEAAQALLPLLEEMRPDLVINDLLTTAPALAAERIGARRATLVPHVWPVHAPGLPFFGIGMAPARTPLGRMAWRAGLPLLEAGLRRGRRELNEVRAQLDLAPVRRFHGGISEDLALVATFPQLEHPRRWPAHVRVTGPMHFELPHPDVELPPGDAPLVLVAPSTAQDPEFALVSSALEGLAEEPVRVIATTNGRRPGRAIAVPPNAVLVDWLSYSQVIPAAALVICHGGHGTLTRALAAGVPVLVSPAAGDMAENGARAAWAGCGLMVPGRLRRPATLRWAVRRILGDDGLRDRARELAAWAAENDGAERGALEVERAVTG